MASCHLVPGFLWVTGEGKSNCWPALGCRMPWRWRQLSGTYWGVCTAAPLWGTLCGAPSWSLLLLFASFLLQPGFLLKQSGWGPVLSSLSWRTWALRVMETGGMRWWVWCYLDGAVPRPYTTASFSSLPALKFCGSVTTNQFEFYMAIIMSLQFWDTSKYMGWYTSGVLKLVDQWGRCWGKFRAYSAKVSSYFQTCDLEYAKQPNNILTV